MSVGYEPADGADPFHGELVFNTGMMGYVESLTDPSYRGQFLVSTYPIVGNYGVPNTTVADEHGIPKFVESDAVHVAGFIMQDYSPHYSHWNADKSLSAWLTEQRCQDSPASTPAR